MNCVKTSAFLKAVNPEGIAKLTDELFPNTFCISDVDDKGDDNNSDDDDVIVVIARPPTEDDLDATSFNAIGSCKRFPKINDGNWTP